MNRRLVFIACLSVGALAAALLTKRNDNADHAHTSDIMANQKPTGHVKRSFLPDALSNSIKSVTPTLDRATIQRQKVDVVRTDTGSEQRAPRFKAVQEQQIANTTNSESIRLCLGEAEKLANEVSALSTSGKIATNVWNRQAYGHLETNHLKYSISYYDAEAANIQQVKITEGDKKSPVSILTLHKDGSVRRFERGDSLEGLGTYPNGMIDYYFKKVPDAKVYRVHFSENGNLALEMLQSDPLKLEERTGVIAVRPR